MTGCINTEPIHMQEINTKKHTEKAQLIIKNGRQEYSNHNRTIIYCVTTKNVLIIKRINA